MLNLSEVTDVFKKDFHNDLVQGSLGFFLYQFTLSCPLFNPRFGSRQGSTVL